MPPGVLGLRKETMTNAENRGPGRPPRPPKPVDPQAIKASAESDADHIARLKGVRDNLTARLVSAPDYAASGIAKVLVDVIDAIESLEQPDRPRPDTALDEFSRRLLAKMGGK